jgi:hypothetical protein
MPDVAFSLIPPILLVCRVEACWSCQHKSCQEHLAAIPPSLPVRNDLLVDHVPILVVASEVPVHSVWDGVGFATVRIWASESSVYLLGSGGEIVVLLRMKMGDSFTRGDTWVVEADQGLSIGSRYSIGNDGVEECVVRNKGSQTASSRAIHAGVIRIKTSASGNVCSREGSGRIMRSKVISSGVVGGGIGCSRVTAGVKVAIVVVGSGIIRSLVIESRTRHGILGNSGKSGSDIVCSRMVDSRANGSRIENRRIEDGRIKGRRIKGRGIKGRRVVLKSIGRSGTGRKSLNMTINSELRDCRVGNDGIREYGIRDGCARIDGYRNGRCRNGSNEIAKRRTGRVKNGGSGTGKSGIARGRDDGVENQGGSIFLVHQRWRPSIVASTLARVSVTCVVQLDVANLVSIAGDTNSTRLSIGILGHAV